MIRSHIVTSAAMDGKQGTYLTKTATFLERDPNYGQRKIVRNEHCGMSKETTRQRTTLAGILRGFKLIPEKGQVKVVTDSQYAIDACTTVDEENSKNADLIQMIKAEMAGNEIEWKKINRENNFIK